MSEQDLQSVPAEAETTPTTFAWLIEMTTHSRPSYWDGRGDVTFTADPNQAVRFARFEDAERVRLWVLRPERRDECASREHGWVAIPSTPEPAPERPCCNCGSSDNACMKRCKGGAEPCCPMCSHGDVSEEPPATPAVPEQRSREVEAAHVALDNYIAALVIDAPNSAANLTRDRRLEFENARGAAVRSIRALVDYRERHDPPDVVALSDDADLTDHDRRVIRQEAWALHDDFAANPDTSAADAALSALREDVARRMDEDSAAVREQSGESASLTNDELIALSAELANAGPLPWFVCADLPMYAIAAADGYRVVSSANQNNIRHFGPSVGWAGMESDRKARAIVAIVNAMPHVLAELTRLRALMSQEGLNLLYAVICNRLTLRVGQANVLREIITKHFRGES